MCQRYDGSIYEPPGVNICDRVEQRATDLIAQLDRGVDGAEYMALVARAYEDAQSEIHSYRDDDGD